MAKQYAVWIEIEEQDEEADTYETLPLMKFGHTAKFDTENEAVAFAVKLHSVAPIIDQLYCQHGRPDNPGPCPWCVHGDDLPNDTLVANDRKAKHKRTR